MKLLLVLSTLLTAPSPDTTVVVSNANLVAVDRGIVVPGVTVVIEGDRIRQVGRASEVTPPPAARFIDGEGHYLVPGLWDMHVHALTTSSREQLEPVLGLFLAHGVTGVRDMGSHPDTLDAVWKVLADPDLPAPRTVVSGPLLDGSRTRWSHPMAWHLVDPDSARVAVRRLVDVGVDFLKIYNRLPSDAYFAVAEEASRLGVPFAGHLPFEVTALEAAKAGQSSFEHGGVDLTAECAPDGRARYMSSLSAWATEGYAARFQSHVDIREDRDPGCLEGLLAEFESSGTSMVPTMVLELKDRSTLATSTMAYLSPEARASCEATVEMIELAPEGLKERAFAGFTADQRRMSEAGIRFLAGSDYPNPCIAAGASLLDELELLAETGMSPLQVLRAATLGPAGFLGLEDSLGSVAAGKLADLVLLDANPLEDVSNLRRIRWVIANGRVLDKSEIDRLRRAGTGG